MPATRQLDPKFTGIRAEMDRIWNQFVVQCEDILEREYSPTLGATDTERDHAVAFTKGEHYAAKRIARSVDHPRYDPIHGNFFRMEPLSVKFKARADECRREAEQYRDRTVSAQAQSLSFKSFMREAQLWDEAAQMAIEGGD